MHITGQAGARYIPRQCCAAKTLNGQRRYSRSNVSAVAASLRQQQQQLTLQLAGVLQHQHKREADKVAEAAQLVHEGAAALLASQDWLQLQQTFQLAARQHNSAAGAATARVSATSSNSSASSKSRTTGSSPWGFALRQPKQQLVQQPVELDPTSSIAPTAANVPSQQQQQQLQLQWDWGSVQHFMMLGQGSIGKLSAGSSSSVSATLQPPPPRLGFRFFQLVMAVALKQALLPGLTSQPAAYDPDYDQFDYDLLAELGFRALGKEPSYDVAGSGAALLYMPCCPRELYGSVLAANNGNLQQLAIFGTSMRSLADTQALVAALVAEPPPPAAAAGTSLEAGRVTDTQTGALASGAQHSSSSSSSSSSVAQQGDVLQLAYQQGCVLEVPSPDCAAHGVGVAVHLFSRKQL